MRGASIIAAAIGLGLALPGLSAGSPRAPGPSTECGTSRSTVPMSAT